LRRELSSPARTLGSWVRTSLKAWMSVCFYSVLLSCVLVAALQRADSCRRSPANCVCIYPSMALQPFFGPWLLFQILDLFTQTVGLLGRGISLSQGRYIHTGKHKNSINAHRHPCLDCDSNPRSQCLSGRKQFIP
jgi:hypothetical protein